MRKITSKKAISISFIVICGVTVWIKLFFSSYWTVQDELLGISLAHMLCKGDSLLVDIWQPTQMGSIFILPFFRIFIIFNKSTEGIALYLRVIYFILKTSLMLFCLNRLKKDEKFGLVGVSAILILYVFTPFNIDSLTYNTLPIMGIMLILTLISSLNESKMDMFICGMVLAFVVLAQPYCALIYLFLIIFMGGVYVYDRKNKKQKEKNEQLPYLSSINGITWMTIGISVVAFLFFLFIFSRASINDLVDNIPYIFSDPDHETDGIIGWFGKLWWGGYGFIFEYKAITIINVITIAFLFCGNKTIKKETLFLLGFGIFFVSEVIVFFRRDSFIGNQIFIPCFWLVIEAYIVFYKKLVQFKFLPGYLIILGYIVGIAFATNTGYLSVTAGVATAVAYTLIILEKTIDEYSLRRILGVIAVLLLGETVITHVIAIGNGYLDLSEYKYVIDEGPLKGTITDKKINDSYNKVINDMNKLEPLEDSSVLCCGTSTPLAYLYLDVEYSTYGPYFFDMDYDRYKLYLEKHPDKYPNVVYYETLEERDKNSFLYDYVKKNFSEIIEEGNSLTARK